MKMFWFKMAAILKLLFFALNGLFGDGTISYTCQLSRLRVENFDLMLAGQFLMPDWKMWVVAVLLYTISKNMLTHTHIRIENHV